MVVKKDGRRGNYDREKIRAGIQRALEKRPVSADDQEALGDRIERLILDAGEKEISTKAIGEMVMEELRDIDAVAYVRFASVYRSFEALEDFREEIQKLGEKDKKD